jgi:DNA-binding transcriptional regulator YhcF (GntR family)
MTATCEPDLVLSGEAPIRRQIQDQLRDHALTGRLLAGEQLPTVRAVAVQLAVNPDLVRLAYDELTREGILSTEEGSGTFVAPAEQIERVKADREAALEQLCEQFLAIATAQGVAPADLLRSTEALIQRRSPQWSRK